MNNFIQLKHSDVPKIREELLEGQEWKCRICGKDLRSEVQVLDHQHKNNKQQPLGEDGAGLVRGVLCRDCNSVEGKITNALKRYKGINTTTDKITFLKALIQYYEYYQQNPTSWIHPTERPQEPDVSKRQYNKLKKVYIGKAKFPEYPKSKKLTTKLKELFNKYDINPYC